MNIFFRELKANRKALFIWSACMFLLVLSGMGKYTAYSSSGASNDIFSKMPYSIRVLLGFGSFDVTTLSGYFALLFSYLEITAAIHAALLGSHIIAKEEQDKTSEFLVTKPVSRTMIITSKLLAALINVVIINLVTLFSSIVMVAVYNKGKDITGEITVFLISMLFVQIIFLFLGTFLSAFKRKPKASGSIATGILLGAFVISKVTDLTKHLNLLNILSPFKYFDFNKIIQHSSLNIWIVLLSLLLSIYFVIFTYFFYRRRDLNI